MRFLALLFVLIPCNVLALNIDLPLANAQDEERARLLFHEIRCVVCQGETIADSPAEVAVDLRRLVREQVAGGADNDNIKNYLVTRYGEVVLMSPPLLGSTFLLWFGPLLMVLVAGLVAYRYFTAPEQK